MKSFINMYFFKHVSYLILVEQTFCIDDDH
jgi:hypothetical protein